MSTNYALSGTTVDASSSTNGVVVNLDIQSIADLQSVVYSSNGAGVLQNNVTGLSDGGFLATWLSSDPATGHYDIYGQRYDALGSSLNSSFLVSTVSSDLTFPNVTSLSDGGFVVTWIDELHDGSINRDVYGQRYAADGSTLGNKFVINTYETGYPVLPSVTGLPDGGFVVTWQTYGQDGDGSGIYGQRYAADSSPVGSEFRVNTTTVEEQIRPCITGLQDGGFVVSWQSYDQNGFVSDIYGQRYAADGSTAGQEFRINTYTDDNQACQA